MNEEQFQKIQSGQGFIAALDQSGGSTPKALKVYGIDENQYSDDDEMFALMHAMRSRIITSPSFSGDHILGAILFEDTMDRDIDSRNSVSYLWDVKRRGPVPESGQGPGQRARRRPGHEPDPCSCLATVTCRAERRLRHQDALLHQAG